MATPINGTTRINTERVTPQATLKLAYVPLDSVKTKDVMQSYCEKYVNSFHLEEPYDFSSNLELEGAAVLNDHFPPLDGLDSHSGYTTEGSADLMTKAFFLDDRKTFQKVFQGLEKYFKVQNNEEYLGGNQDLYKWGLNENVQPLLRHGVPDVSSASDADLIICSNLYRMAKRINSDSNASADDKRLAGVYMNRAKRIAISLVRNMFVDGGDSSFSYMASSYFDKSAGQARVDYWNPMAYKDIISLLPEESKEKKVAEKVLADLPELLNRILFSEKMTQMVNISGRNVIALEPLNYEVRLPYRIATYIKDLTDTNNIDELQKWKGIAITVLNSEFPRDNKDSKAARLYNVMKSTLAHSLVYASKKVALTDKDISTINKYSIDPITQNVDSDTYYETNLVLQASFFVLVLRNYDIKWMHSKYQSDIGDSTHLNDIMAYHYAASSYIQDLKEDNKGWITESLNSVSDPSQYFSRASLGQMTRRLLTEKKGDMNSEELVRLANKNFAYGAFHSAQKLYYEYLFHTDVNKVLKSDSKSVLYRYTLGSPDPETVFMMRAIDAFKICMDTNAVRIEDQIAAFERILYRKDSNRDENQELADLIIQNKSLLINSSNRASELKKLLESYFVPVLSESNKNPIDYANHRDILEKIIKELSSVDFKGSDDKTLNEKLMSILVENNNNDGNIFVYPLLASLYLQNGEVEKAINLLAVFSTGAKTQESRELANNKYNLAGLADFPGVRELNQWTRKYANHPYISRFVLDSLNVVSKIFIQENNMQSLGNSLENMLKIDNKFYVTDSEQVAIKEYKYEYDSVQKQMKTVEVNLPQIDMHEYFSLLSGIDKKGVDSELYFVYGRVLLEDALLTADKSKMKAAVQNLFKALSLESESNNRTVLQDQILRSIIKAYNNVYDLGVKPEELHDLGIPDYICLVKFVFEDDIVGNDQREVGNLKMLKSAFDNISSNDKNLIVGLKLNLNLYAGYLAFNLANNTDDDTKRKAQLETLVKYMIDMKKLRSSAKGLGENEFLDVRTNQLLANTYISLDKLYEGLSIYDALLMLRDRLNGISHYNVVGGRVSVSGSLGREAYTSIIVVPKENSVDNILRVVAYNSEREAMIIDVPVISNSSVRFHDNKVTITTSDGVQKETNLSDMKYGSFYALDNENNLQLKDDVVTKEVLNLYSMKINSQERLRGNVNLELIYESNPLLYGEVTGEFLKIPLWKEFSTVLKTQQMAYKALFVNNFMESRGPAAKNNVEAVLSTIDSLIDAFEIAKAKELIGAAKELIKNNYYYLSVIRLDILEMKLDMLSVLKNQSKGDLTIPDSQENRQSVTEIINPEQFAVLVEKLKADVNVMHKDCTYGELNVLFDVILDFRRYVSTIFFNKELRQNFEKEGSLEDIKTLMKFFDDVILSDADEEITIGVVSDANLKDIMQRIASSRNNLMNNSYLTRRSIKEGMSYLRGLVYLSIQDKIHKKLEDTTYQLTIVLALNIYKDVNALSSKDPKFGDALSLIKENMETNKEVEPFKEILSIINELSLGTKDGRNDGINKIKDILDSYLKANIRRAKND